MRLAIMTHHLRSAPAIAGVNKTTNAKRCSFHVVITTNAQRVRLHMSPKWYFCNVETPLMLLASSTFDRGIHSFETSKAQPVILLTWSPRCCLTAPYAQLFGLDTFETPSAQADVR